MGRLTVVNVGVISFVVLAATQWAIASTISFIVVFLGYLATSYFLEVVYYPSPLPRFQPKAENHEALTLLNLLMASVLAMIAAECHIRGLSYMDFDSLPSILTILGQVSLAFVFENTIEYYWHRFLHLRWPYAIIHKVHHHYKKTRPFDDMYMHPFEGFAYYCILYGPPFVFHMHIGSFAIYMILMAVFGVMDHSGVQFQIKHVYNSTDHDVHHARFNFNYGFPFQYLDIVHGTYLSPSKAFKE
ncbi:sterol desaturase [Thraustotheca clavata]|uniref:Sterol desaturase n=1 Tax=Thraustotheca clavata TaxID=74557 RepID=A0A1V9ZYH7_9STRA|nr:sterol desaturase [Thraustotheca clavata]